MTVAKEAIRVGASTSFGALKGASAALSKLLPALIVIVGGLTAIEWQRCRLAEQTLQTDLLWIELVELRWQDLLMLASTAVVEGDTIVILEVYVYEKVKSIVFHDGRINSLNKEIYEELRHLHAIDGGT